MLKIVAVEVQAVGSSGT